MEIGNALIQRGTGEIQSILFLFVTENYLWIYWNQRAYIDFWMKNKIQLWKKGGSLPCYRVYCEILWSPSINTRRSPLF